MPFHEADAIRKLAAMIGGADPETLVRSAASSYAR